MSDLTDNFLPPRVGKSLAPNPRPFKSVNRGQHREEEQSSGQFNSISGNPSAVQYQKMFVNQQLNFESLH